MSDRNYLCSVCGANFLSLTEFKGHLEEEHPGNADEIESPAGPDENDYRCHFCPRKFRHKKLLRRHLQTNHVYTEVSPADIKKEMTDDAPPDDHNYMDQIIKYERDDFTEETDFVCKNCGGVFSTLFNLRKHVKSKHPGLLDTLAPRKKVGVFSCDECGHKFSHRKSLGRHKIGKHKSSAELKECGECGKTFLNLVNFHKHMKNKHPYSTATLVLQGIREGEFECTACGRVFSQRKNLRRHVVDKHKDVSPAYTGKPVAIYQCPLCPFNKSGDVSLIVSHFSNEHGIRVVTKEREFDSKESFYKWKEDLEHSTRSYFVKKAHVGQTSYFRCHRSGKYRPRGKGIRNLKVQGTNKINGFCPAGMQVRITDKYHVKYSETHVGHTNDPKHLKLTVRERQDLVNEIASQLSIDEIISNMRRTGECNEDEVTRVNLVTKQDLNNLMRKYQLASPAVRNTYTDDCLDDWLLGSRQNILYYKPRNCPDTDQPQLSPHHLLLILMTESQRDTLLRFGGGCVCLDRTDATGGRLNLCTVSVVDGSKSTIPTAFLISSKQDGEVLEFFFKTLRQVVGDINPGVLLTDVAEDYYSAWVKAMGEPGQTLFCLWHVERDWKESLARLVPEAEVNSTFSLLRSLVIERNPAVFHKKLLEVCNMLFLNPDTSDFAKYFTENYSENFQYWATAYRPEDTFGIDANFERLHYSLRYLYTDNRRNLTLDKTLNSILQYVESKLFEGASDRKKCKKPKNIMGTHKSSCFLNTNNVFQVGNSWYISLSYTSYGGYRVDEVDPECDCESMCDACGICVHRFVCTCRDNVLKHNMCKHIHLVGRCLKELGSEEVREDSEVMPPGYAGEIVIMETDEGLNPDCDSSRRDTDEPPRSSNVLSEKKVKIASLINEIMGSINSVDEGDAFLQILQAAKPTVASLRSDTGKTLYITSSDTTESRPALPVKRVLYTAPATDPPDSVEAHPIEAHITLDSDGITLLSQAANLATASQ